MSDIFFLAPKRKNRLAFPDKYFLTFRHPQAPPEHAHGLFFQRIRTLRKANTLR